MMQVKIKTMVALVAASVCVGTAVYADGIAVKEAKFADFSAEEYAQYLQNYDKTQVSDLILPLEIIGDKASEIEKATQTMDIDTVYSYTVPKSLDISGLSWDSVPGTAYGIELDFVSNAGNELVSGREAKRAALTEKLKNLKENAGNKRIYVKVPRDMSAAYDMGLDIYSWSDEKLCDVIEVSCVGNETDTDMSIDFWRKAINSQIQIYAVIGNYTDIPANGGRTVTLENTAALANMYLSEGADKIYLNNFGFYAGATYEPLREGDSRSESAAAVIIRACGSLQTLADENMRFVAANSVTGGVNASQNYSPLPIELVFGQYNRFRIKTGNIPADADVKLILGVNKGDASTAKNAIGKLYVNTSTPTYEYTADNMIVDASLSDGEILVYSVDAAALNSGNQVIEMLTYSQNVEVDYAEIRVYPKNNGFIYKNLALTAANEGRNVLNAAADTEYSYTVTAEKKGIYSVGLCYNSSSQVNIKLNGSEYALPANTDLTAHGFAAVRLSCGENTIKISADKECNLNYLVLCYADICVNSADEEITNYKDGILTVNCNLSGLLSGQDFMLIAAVYKNGELVNAEVQSNTVTNADYTMILPINASGGDTLKVYLWDNADKLIPYADVKIYE